MREMRVRVWNPYNKTMYIPTKDEDVLLGPSYELGLWDGGWEMYEITALDKRIVVASITKSGETGGVLMLDTGLKDKNGLEIYDGDIVRTAGMEVNQVYFGEIIISAEGDYKVIMNGWMIKGGGTDDALDPQIGPVVIGNIYENPELLQETR